MPTPTPSSTEDPTPTPTPTPPPTPPPTPTPIPTPTPTPIPWKLSANLVKVGFVCNRSLATLNENDYIDITDEFKEMLEEVERTDEIQASGAEQYICNQASILGLGLPSVEKVSERAQNYEEYACQQAVNAENRYQGSRKFFDDLDEKIYQKYEGVSDNVRPPHANIEDYNNPCAGYAADGETPSGMFHGYIIRYTDENDDVKHAFVPWGEYIDLKKDFDGNYTFSNGVPLEYEDLPWWNDATKSWLES